LPLGLRLPPWRSRHLAMLAPALRAPVASDDHASRSRFACVFRRELPRSSAWSPRRSRGSPAVAFTLRIPLPRARRGHWRFAFARSRDHLAMIACGSHAPALASTDARSSRSPCGSRHRARRGHWRIRAHPLPRPPCGDRVRCSRVRSSSHASPALLGHLAASKKTRAPCSLAAPIIARVPSALRHQLRPRRSSRPDVSFRARPRAPRDARVRARIEDVSTSLLAIACAHLAMPALARQRRHPDVSACGHPPAKTSPAFPRAHALLAPCDARTRSRANPRLGVSARARSPAPCDACSRSRAKTPPASRSHTPCSGPARAHLAVPAPGVARETPPPCDGCAPRSH